LKYNYLINHEKNLADKKRLFVISKKIQHVIYLDTRRGNLEEIWKKAGEVTDYGWNIRINFSARL